MEDQDRAINRLALILGGLGLGGVGLAGGLGLVVTRTATRPVRELSETAEHVARTRDLSRRIEAQRRRRAEPAGRLVQHDAPGARPLDALAAPARVDASHELRTPLTSVRTNLEVLARATARCPRPSARACCAT